jgi:glycosyltransferase involved in cell wall biosynthesis
VSKISVIVPCYFNEESIPHLGKALFETEQKFPAETELEYIFVDDHSGDRTLDELLQVKSQKPEQIKVLQLAENVGSHRAVLAGLEYASGDCFAIMAADLQDPPELLPQLFAKWKSGNKLVIAYREKLDSRFSKTFHSIMKTLTGAKTPNTGFDVVLFDNSFVPQIVNSRLSSVNLFYFLNGLESEPILISYQKQERKFGQSKWTSGKKLKFFLSSVFYFSPIGKFFSPRKSNTTIDKEY